MYRFMAWCCQLMIHFGTRTILGDLWNCKCGITNTDKKATTDVPEIDYTPEAGIDENPAKTGSIFSDTHPYIAEPYDGADKAVKSFLKTLD